MLESGLNKKFESDRDSACKPQAWGREGRKITKTRECDHSGNTACPDFDLHEVPSTGGHGNSRQDSGWTALYVMHLNSSWLEISILDK